MVALNHGAAMIYPSESFQARAALEAISKEKCSAIYGVPTMFIAMLEELKKMTHIDTSNLRTGIIAGSLCPKPLMQTIIHQLKLSDITNCYG
jgi:fatty-acyl-CoA synthase